LDVRLPWWRLLGIGITIWLRGDRSDRLVQ
jgi:hypothetical protein